MWAFYVPYQPCPSANLQSLKVISGDQWNIPVANAFNGRIVFKKACTNLPLPLNSHVMSWGPLLRRASLYLMCFAYDLFPLADSELFAGQIHVWCIFCIPPKDPAQCHMTINQHVFKGVPWPLRDSISPLSQFSQMQARQNLHSGVGEGRTGSLGLADANYDG